MKAVKDSAQSSVVDFMDHALIKIKRLIWRGKEEFLDDSSWEQLDKAVPIIKRRRAVAA
ncbi:MAG: hypothetical protein ONB46_04495 [candidate division KSB1 bacterium]|nr:hypothetical protein [candidate division KSB1 bacterium]MDZ7365120.1 hypothetical protein [candidate division KSB1 bacterium]MDZ7404330.1 hypothetical protein [candidate division KSB1 bacterium]